MATEKNFKIKNGLSIGDDEVISTVRRFYASDGTSAKAAYSFDGESSTGMYKYGSNQIGFTAGGNLMAYIQSGATYGLVVQSKISATGGNSDNWNTAYGWGDHSTQGYLTSADLSGYLTSESDTLASVTGRGNTTTNSISVGTLSASGSTNVYAATFTGATGPSVTSLGLNVKTLDGANDVALLVEKTDGTDLFKITGQGVGSFSQRISVQSQDITGTRIQNWQTAYGWGDHSAAGYLTSETSHADVVVDGDFASSGLMKRGSSAGSYSIVTDNSSNWNTAYGWGDHSTQGYLTSADLSGYLTAEADTLATVTGRGNTTTNAISTGTITTSGNVVLNNGQITSNGSALIIDGASAKEVEIKSARDIRLVIDDNNDDTDNQFELYKHSVTSGNELLIIDQSGNMTASNNITADGSFVTATSSQAQGIYAGSTQVFEGSTRNLINIGTISSGSITSSGNITAGSGSGFITAGTTSGYVYAKSLRLNNAETTDTDFQFAYQMIVDANDVDSDVPNHGNTAGSGPFGVYFLGDNSATTKTLGSGLVKLWHTGHFTKAHIDHFVGLQGGTQNLTAPDINVTGNLDIAQSIRHKNDEHTGIDFYSDQVIIKTNNTERLNITNSDINIKNTQVFFNSTMGIGASTYAPIEGATDAERNWLNFHRANNASYVEITNRTPGGKVVLSGGLDGGGGEVQRLEIEGGSATKSVKVLASTDLNLSTTSKLTHGTNTVLDASRNLTNIGTISSGAITSTGNLTARTGTFSGQNGTALNVNSGTTNVAAKFESGDNEVWINLKDNNSSTYGALLGHANDALFKVADNSVNVRMLLSDAGLLDTDSGYSVGGTTVIDSSRNLTNIGTISSGAISSGAIDASGNSEFDKIDIVNTDQTEMLRIRADDTISNTDFNALYIDHNSSGSQAHTADHIHRSILVDLDSSATGGDTSNEHRVRGIESNVRVTGDSDTVYGIFGYAEGQNSADIVTEVVGVYGQAVADEHTTGSVSHAYALRGIAYGYGQGTGGTTTFYGTHSKVHLTTAQDKNSAALYGGFFDVETDDPGQAQSTGNLYGVHATWDDDSGGNVTANNAYLFYGNYEGTNNVSGGKYGVFIASDCENRFTGMVRTNSQFNVSGTTVIDSDRQGIFTKIKHDNTLDIVIDLDDNTYTKINNPDGDLAISIGGGGNTDLMNRYINDLHRFRKADDTTDLALFMDGSITLYEPVSADVIYSDEITLSSGAPSTTTNKLYNVGGSLYFNGSAVGGASSFAFNDLTGKTSGTGDYKTTGKFRSTDNIRSGEGSGGVAMTINDGYGNANLTFNHEDGVPEQNGNAARIEVNTDSSSAATMWFEVKSGVTNGTAVQTDAVFQADDSGIGLASGKTLRSVSGQLTLQANDVDFVVQDTTDSLTNFIWRDHSASKLYLGSTGADVELRSHLTLQSGNNITLGGTITSGQITSSGSVTAGNASTSLGFYVGSTQVLQGSTRDLVNIGQISLSSNITNSDGYIEIKKTGSAPAIFDRLGTTGSSGTSNGEILNFKTVGTKRANIGYNVPYGSRFHIGFDTGSFGLQFYNFSSSMYIAPSQDDGANKDNLVDLGSSSSRWDDVYATNGTIQTSDRNEKQDIQALTDAETRAATACKGLIRRFRWVDSVQTKGEDARYHFGAIAQDVEDAFTAEGLNAGDYALFIKNHWWEYEGVSYPTAEEAPTGAVEKIRRGIRYNQLLAFIISAI